jgi:GT2 family glycosyltransferase
MCSKKGNVSFTAVIPTINRPVDLVVAVKSIIKQVRQPEELVIVDQSPNQESKELVLALLEKEQYQFKLNYILDAEIDGLIAAKKRAVKESSQEIVCFLEDDIVLFEDYLLELEKAYISFPEILGCGGIIVAEEGYSSFYRIMFNLFHRGLFHDPRMELFNTKPDSNDKRLVQSRFISGGVSSYRSEVFEKVPFDTANNLFALEDIDFSTRAAYEFGEDKFFINTSARLWHLMSPVNRYSYAPRWERKAREFSTFYKKNNHMLGSKRDFSLLVLGLLLEGVYSSIRCFHIGPFYGTIKGLIKGARVSLLPYK